MLSYKESMELFEKTLREDDSSSVEKILLKLCIENGGKAALRYKKAFFYVMREYNPKMAISYAEEVIEHINDLVLMRQLALEHKKSGNIERFEQLSKELSPTYQVNKQLKLMVEEKEVYASMEKYIDLKIKEFPRLKKEISKIAFSMFKDSHTLEALKYGEDAIDDKTNSKFIKVLAIRYKRLNKINRYNQLMKKIFPPEQIEKQLKKMFEEKRNFSSIQKYIDLKLSEYPKQGELLKRLVFVIFKDRYTKEVLPYAEELLTENSSDAFIKVVAIRYQRVANIRRYEELMSRLSSSPTHANKVEKISKNSFVLDEARWFPSSSKAIEIISYTDNKLFLALDFKSYNKPFYITSCNPQLTYMGIEYANYNVSDYKLFEFVVEIENRDHCDVSIIILEFNDERLVTKTVVPLSESKNKFTHYKSLETKYLKLSFSFFSEESEYALVKLNKFNVNFLKEIPIVDEAMEESISVINSKKSLPMKLFFLTTVQHNTLDYFKPRENSKLYKLDYPLDWSIDPFKDRNWCFQLHAWRMMDCVLLDYKKSKKIEKLVAVLAVVEDWYSYIIERKKKAVFAWYDMATGLRALKLVYIATQIFAKEHSDKISQKHKKMILSLMNKHIEVLQNQKITPNNHGIFQVHGLMLLSWLLNNEESQTYALKEMDKLIEEQFYDDGFHVENSDKYHLFVLNIFTKFISFDVYKNDKKILKRIEQANKSIFWTVFPNYEPLLMGDTDAKQRKITFPVENSEDMQLKFFKNSGYVFVRSSFKTESQEASMLFFQTAFQNTNHRHADDFNILLYEYGLNILVDAGQHSYNYKSDERKYVISTRAHNTVMIDRKNYIIDQSAFYESALKSYEENQGMYILKTLLYRKEFEVTHHRIVLYEPRKFLIVLDLLDGDKKKHYEQFWHFHETLSFEKEGDGFCSKINDNTSMMVQPMIMNLDNKLLVWENNKDKKLLKGEKKEELQGWRSLKHNSLIENYALEQGIAAKKAFLMTKFIFSEKNMQDIDPEIEVGMDSEGELFFNVKMANRVVKVNV